MGSNPEVLEISSGEEEDNTGFGKIPREDEVDWLSEMLEKDDSDEVVVVGEVKASSASVLQSKKTLDDDEDDCLILDADPDKPVELKANGADDGSEEELLIVGEKGQLACRDYPHARHLCAKFPFSITPHANTCDQCHCYVCDTLAPCSYWGTGELHGDHCNSNDKEEVWKLRRKYLQHRKTTQVQPQKLPDTALPVALPLNKSGSTLDPSQPLHSNYHPQYRLKSNQLRACSSTNSYSVPGIISNRNNQRSGVSMARSRLPYHVSRPQPVHGSNYRTDNALQRDRSSGNAGSLGHHFSSPHTDFKRAGTPGVAWGRNRPRHGVSSHENHMARSQRNHHTPVTGNDDHHSRREDSFFGTNAEPNAYHGSSQSSVANNIVDSHSYYVTSQSSTYTQPLPHASDIYQDTHHFTSQPACNGSINSDSYNVSLQPSLYSQPTQTSEVFQNTNLHEYHPSALNDLNPDTANFDLSLQQFPNLQPTSEILTEDAASQTEFDLDSWSWIQSLDHHQLDTGSLKDTVAAELSFTAHQAEIENENLLVFDFENC